MRDGIKALAILVPILAVISFLFWYQRTRDHRIEAEQSDAAWAARLESAKQYINTSVADGDARAQAISTADKAHAIVRQEMVKGRMSADTWPPPEEPEYREKLFAEMARLARSDGRAGDAAQFQRWAAIAAGERSTGLAGLDELKRQMKDLKLDLSTATRPATQKSAGSR